MNTKLQESAVYLKGFNDLELQSFQIYEALSKKINQPESSFLLGLAYDCLKCSKILQGILDHLDFSDVNIIDAKKDITELTAEIGTFTKIISKINNLNPLLTGEILSELINMEDLTSEAYTDYISSSTTKFVADEFSKLIPQSSNNFKKVFDSFVEQKERHREILIEVIYNLEAKETERLRHITPVVKYQNPDAWYHESSIHAFSKIPVRAKAQP